MSAWGVKAEVVLLERHVRSAFKSRHRRATLTCPLSQQRKSASRTCERNRSLSESCEPQPIQMVLHISPADDHRIFAAALMTTTVVRAAPALGPAAALWLAATKASAPAYASGWQSAVVEALMSWAAGSARKPWR
jgi:hypothetical protein